MEELLNKMAPKDANVSSENIPLPQRKGNRRGGIMDDKTVIKTRIDSRKHRKIKANSNNVAEIDKTSELQQKQCVTDKSSDKDLVSEVSKKVHINNVNEQ